MLKLTVMFGRFNELPGADQAQSIDLAKMAEDAGLYGLALGEHVALGLPLGNYPYAGGLRHPEGAKAHYIEPIAALSAFAAVTKRIRLSTCIMLAPLRQGVLLAKQLASVDVLSRGRVEPVFGTGWSHEEYASLNVDYAKRRQIMMDNIGACRALWGEQPATFKSETVSFTDLCAMPQPIQKRIPIILGIKANDRNVQDMAKLCDGWECGPDDSKQPGTILKEGVEKLRAAYKAIGRDTKDMIVKAHLPIVWENEQIILEKSFEKAGPMIEAGANQFALPLPVNFGKAMSSMADLNKFLQKMGRLAEQY
jgi:probable F420-dependent oxidoreductase